MLMLMLLFSCFTNLKECLVFTTQNAFCFLCLVLLPVFIKKKLSEKADKMSDFVEIPLFFSFHPK